MPDCLMKELFSERGGKVSLHLIKKTIKIFKKNLAQIRLTELFKELVMQLKYGGVLSWH